MRLPGVRGVGSTHLGVGVVRLTPEEIADAIRIRELRAWLRAYGALLTGRTTR